jgi:hypothetical protein
MSTTTLVDSSYDQLTIDEARCLKRGGCYGFVQCLLALPTRGPEHPASRVASLENAIAAGLEVYGYVLVGSQLPGGQYIDMARQGVPDGVWDALGFVAVDIETPNVNVQQAREAFDRLRHYGQPVDVLYTSYHAWTSLVFPRNDKTLAQRGVKLWAAEWDNLPAPDLDYLYGGWQQSDVVIKQYTGGSMKCGQYVDNNVASLEWLQSLKEDDDMGMTPDEEARVAGIERNLGAIAAAAGEKIAALAERESKHHLEHAVRLGYTDAEIAKLKEEGAEAGLSKEEIAQVFEAVAAQVRDS